MVSVFPCHLEIKHKRRRTGALSLKNKPEQTYSYCVFWSGLKGTYGPRNFDWIARNGRLSAESRGKPNVINADFYHKGDFCLIGLSNLEFHWLIHWNLVNSFESREDDCQLCHTSTVGFPLSSFLFVYAIMTRFECKLLVLWILWLLLISYGGKFFNWKKIVGNDRQRYKTWWVKKTSIRRHET